MSIKRVRDKKSASKTVSSKENKSKKNLNTKGNNTQQGRKQTESNLSSKSTKNDGNTSNEDEESQGLHFFTHERTFLLLNVYNKFEDKFSQPRRQPYILWRLVATTMEKEGCRGVTGRLCSEKFKNLKTRYLVIRKRLGQTGSGGEPTWPYYSLMNEVLRRNVAVNPDNIVEACAARFNRIKRNSVFQNEDDEPDNQLPVNKRKRISNSETLEMILKSEAEREKTNSAFLEVLDGFRRQGERKNQLLEQLLEKKKGESDLTLKTLKRSSTWNQPKKYFFSKKVIFLQK